MPGAQAAPAPDTARIAQYAEMLGEGAAWFPYYNASFSNHFSQKLIPAVDYSFQRDSCTQYDCFSSTLLAWSGQDLLYLQLSILEAPLHATLNESFEWGSPTNLVSKVWTVIVIT